MTQALRIPDDRHGLRVDMQTDKDEHGQPSLGVLFDMKVD